MSEPTLTLFSDSLLSKWGFNDGDVPGDFLDYYEEQTGTWSLPDWHSTLVALVKRYLVPQLDQEIELVEILTNHNPIRAHKVNGEEITHSRDYGEILTPEYVEVPFSEILKVIQELDNETPEL